MACNRGEQAPRLRCILPGEDDSIHAGMVWSSVFYIMAQSPIRYKTIGTYLRAEHLCKEIQITVKQRLGRIKVSWPIEGASSLYNPFGYVHSKQIRQRTNKSTSSLTVQL